MLDTQTLAPFDTALNDAVLHITERIVGPFDVSDDAPGTYRDLKAHLDSGQRMVVASEGSDHTIFADPATNYAFRAWHDWCHWRGERDFSLSGEMETCCIQLSHLQRFYGISERTCYWRSLIIAEVIGQRRYYEKYRSYITDQRAFARAYLENPEAALRHRW